MDLLKVELLMFMRCPEDWMCCLGRVVLRCILRSFPDTRCSRGSWSGALGCTVSPNSYQFGWGLLVLPHPSLVVAHELSRALNVVDLSGEGGTFSEGRMKAGVAWQLSLLKMAPS